MITSKFQSELSRLVGGSLAAAKIFYTGLAAFLVENAKTRVNPTLALSRRQRTGYKRMNSPLAAPDLRVSCTGWKRI